MKYTFVILLIAGLFASCSKSEDYKSENPYFEYFYPVDSTAKIYLYRDIANGLDEQFHRIFSIKDSAGIHVVVEIYAPDGRILEALNYNIDSLDIMDHMVVNRNLEKTKAEVYKNKIIPMNNSEEVWFATRFPGFLDSTLILKEIKRKVSGEPREIDVMGENVTSVVMKDKIRMTNYNPFTKNENSIEGTSLNYFAKGYGLVEWHTPDKKVHYKLENIMSQEEWVKIITR